MTPFPGRKFEFVMFLCEPKKQSGQRKKKNRGGKMFRTSWTARCVAAAARVSETAASSSPTATNARNTASDASGDLASSGTPVAEKYQRVSLHFNKVNNFVFFLLILLPFAIFPTFFTEKVRPLLGQFKDPYALPQGFDPNTATPEEVARRIQQQEAASSTAMKRPLLTSSEPGKFSMTPEASKNDTAKPSK